MSVLGASKLNSKFGTFRKTNREAALLECISYYQRRLPEVYSKLSSLQSKVDSFLVQFEDGSDD